MAKQRAARRKPVILVFGEDDNDRQMLVEVMRGLRSDLPAIKKRRKPLILIRDREQAKQRKNAQDIAAAVKRDSRRYEVTAVVVHQDCDAVEPAHILLSQEMKAKLAEIGLQVAAAAPAFESEAWLFLWPDAARDVNKRWRRPTRTGKRVGLITHAKEEYRRALRPPRDKRCRDYEESDAPLIAGAARARGLIPRPDAVSHSFDLFADEVKTLKF